MNVCITAIALELLLRVFGPNGVIFMMCLFALVFPVILDEYFTGNT